MQTPTAPIVTSATGPAPAEGRVLAAVRAAAEATGVPFDYLLAQANQESGLDPGADNRRSSASGLFQFTASTWLDMIHRHGAEIGLGRYADAIATGGDGHLHVADKQTKRAILDLRHNPEISARMAAEYAKDNQRSLQARLGRPISSHDLYLAHFLGAGGAAKVLEGMGSHSAAHLLPEAAKANPEVFREPGSGKSRSVTSLYNVVQYRFAGAMGEVAPLVHPRPNQPARTDLAALRPEPRPDSDEQIAALAPPAAAPVDSPFPASASSGQPSTPFTNAIEPASPFFPVRLAPRKV